VVFDFVYLRVAGLGELSSGVGGHGWMTRVWFRWLLYLKLGVCFFEAVGVGIWYSIAIQTRRVSSSGG
jgi:hypothetical protein